MNTQIPIMCLLGSLLRTVALEPSSEQAIELRLHEILGTRSEVRDTVFGGRLRMVAIPLDSRTGKKLSDFDVRLEQANLFTRLEQLGTREAVRVLASFLADERYIYEPGDDYGSHTIAEYAENSLSIIQHRYPHIVPGAPSPPDPLDKMAWGAWMRSINNSPLAAWRKWWAANKAAYETRSPTMPISK